MRWNTTAPGHSGSHTNKISSKRKHYKEGYQRKRHNEGDTMLVVKAKIKEYATGYNVAGDFADALDQKAVQLIKDAIKRADANGRRTVMAKDL